MTSQDACDLLDELGVTTRDAARYIGCGEVTLQMYLRGRRYPSHGGKELPIIPTWIERGLVELREKMTER